MTPQTVRQKRKRLQDLIGSPRIMVEAVRSWLAIMLGMHLTESRLADRYEYVTFVIPYLLYARSCDGVRVEDSPVT